MIQIRKCETADLDALVELFDAYRVFYKKDSDKVSAKKFLYERISNNESIIFVSQNKAGFLTGFVQLYPIFSSTRMKRLWLLNDLFVEPHQRGKGISKKLIQQAQQLCTESGSCGMILETAKSNHIGNQLYPSTGFELDNDHNYYSWDC
jgi:GNAT superfamily N-acetyltransferase